MEITKTPPTWWAVDDRVVVVEWDCCCEARAIFPRLPLTLYSLNPPRLFPQMPPKKNHKDWSWVSLIDNGSEVTREHCRLAAGLHPSNSPKACPSPHADRSKSKSKTPAKGERNGNGKRAISVDSTATEASVVIVSEKKGDCQARRCLTNPRCFNHLGMEKVGSRAPGGLRAQLTAVVEGGCARDLSPVPDGC